MTNLTVGEKMALEEVFECLKDRHCRKFKFADKRYLSHRVMRFYLFTRRFIQGKR